MRGLIVLFCALYAVSAQDPQLAPVVVLPGGQPQGTQAEVREDNSAIQNNANAALSGPSEPVQVNSAAANENINSRRLPVANVYQPARPVPVQTNYRPVSVVQVQTGNQEQAAQTLSAIDASRQQIAAVVAQGANPNHFGIQTNARYNIAQQPNVQNPVVFVALDALRGRAALTIDEILNILSNAVPGRDYPVYNDIPNTRFSCENVHQAGFYADAEAQCQVIRRCDINGVLWSYLCPNMTLFNQITLVCDWFFNVNCNNAVQYYDYSNPRLYTQFALLDTPAPGPIIAPVNPAVYRPNYVLANQPYPNQQG